LEVNFKINTIETTAEINGEKIDANITIKTKDIEKLITFLKSLYMENI